MGRGKKKSDRDRFLKDYSEWLDKEENRRFHLEDPTAAIEKRLATGFGPFTDRTEVSTQMSCIGPYYSILGSVRSFGDPREGWRLLKRSLLYRYWVLRIVARARDFWRTPRRGPKRSFRSVASVASTAAMLLVLARDEGIWLLDLMEASLTDGSLDWEPEDFYAAYLLRLRQKLEGEADIANVPPNPDDWQHPFGDLIEHWNNEEKLAEAILAMCDYHLVWNKDTRDRWGEFCEPLAFANPVEIHALEAVRSELGLSTPQVKHELLQPPFYPIPDFAKQITTEEILEEDDLLRRVIEANQAWCDGLEE